jgi:hypothetical protein
VFLNLLRHHLFLLFLQFHLDNLVVMPIHHLHHHLRKLLNFLKLNSLFLFHLLLLLKKVL